MIKLTHMNNFVDKKLYIKGTYELNPGLYFLVGPNGTGKSTFLNIVEQYAKKQEINCIAIHEDLDRGTPSIEKLFHQQNFLAAANYSMSSEGERIYHNVSDNSLQIGSAVTRTNSGEQLILLMDGIDSGLDIKRLQEMKDLLHMIEHDCELKGIEYYILVTANNYAFIEGETCFDVKNLKNITFDSYQDFVKFILRRYKYQETAEEKQKKQKAKEILQREKDRILKTGIEKRRDSSRQSRESHEPVDHIPDTMTITDDDLKDLEYSSEYSQEYKESNFTDLDTSALVDTNWINNDWD